jgi:hypothetical protein
MSDGQAGITPVSPFIYNGLDQLHGLAVESVAKVQAFYETGPLPSSEIDALARAGEQLLPNRGPGYRLDRTNARTKLDRAPLSLGVRWSRPTGLLLI